MNKLVERLAAYEISPFWVKVHLMVEDPCNRESRVVDILIDHQFWRKDLLLTFSGHYYAVTLGGFAQYF
ncbi:MAG: hypothetical protein ACJA04_000624 [Cellvibrionaceae bacterium]|jgi:hypothetical protein